MSIRAFLGASGSGPRLQRLDRLRGLAVLAMVVYHFCWNLAALNYVSWNLVDGGVWIVARTAIITAFLVIAGVAHALTGPGFGRGARLRLLKLAVAAGLVTVGTLIVFPDAAIFFGVLHCLAVAGLLVLPMMRLPRSVVAVVGVAMIVLPQFVQLSILDPWWVLWLGMGQHVPITNDWVPLMPFAGIVMIGLAIGQWVLDSPARSSAILGKPRSAEPVLRDPLAFAGRWSLVIYLVHQPILFGGLSLLSGVAAETVLNNQCRIGCLNSGSQEAVCLAYCHCIVDGFEPDVLARVAAGSLQSGDQSVVDDVVAQCLAQEVHSQTPNGGS